MSDDLDNFRRQFLAILQPYAEDLDNPDRLTLLSNSFNVALTLGDLERCLDLYGQVADQAQGNSSSQFYGAFKYMTRRLSDTLAPSQVRTVQVAGDGAAGEGENDPVGVSTEEPEITEGGGTHF